MTKAVAVVSSCNECHSQLALHGGGRIEIEYCVVCHNPGTQDANSGNVVDMATMTHKIHMGSDLPSGEYTIWGYRDGEHDYSHVGYPQARNNCVKCHNPDDAETPDAINYLERPTMETCGACHDDVDFSDGTGHTGGAASDNSNCATCHSAEAIAGYHVSENATENNPDLPDGYYDITYELVSATVSGSDLTVEFKIYVDGTEIDMTDLPSDLASPGRWPGFLLAWAEPQDGIDEPADFTNTGNEAGQPTSVSIGDLVDGDGGSMSYSGGTNTAVITDAFPDGATLRAVYLQGYFQQELDGENVSRHAISTYIPVDGDDERRDIVDPAACGACHEWFEGHGGNRVIGMESNRTMCDACHVPNLSSSGREISLDNPEASQNLKDLVHGVHGASVRDYPLDFVRNRGSGYYYTFVGSEDQLEEYPDGHLVTYPTSPANCLMCHYDGTYLPEAVPAGAIVSIELMGDEAVDEADYTTYREEVPNDDDWIISPVAAACSSCHNSDLATAHMEQNGGAYMMERAVYMGEDAVETCALCHGSGRSADVEEVHGL